MLNFLNFFHEEPTYIFLCNWFTIGNLKVDYAIYLDSLSLTVIVPVGIVTLTVLFYAIDYMKYDPNRNRFYIILSVFAIFMTILVVSSNYLLMFIGWEFVGVISYLLISFWNTRISAMKSALSAILMNRMGDAFFVIFICIIISSYGSVEFNVLELIIPHVNTSIINILSIMLIIAATAKSAQLGLHSWLLLAMEGPTPVSALLHAATMVCSGIFVLVRSFYILEYSPTALLIIIWLGGLTTLISGLIATVTNDIKRVIALSTMSQLSMMMLAIGSSAYDLAIYHLYCHAFFKALLFMSAGSIIHSLISETQDMRKYGGLINYLPLSYTNMLIASLSLMAIPGLTGYYSKDIIIENLYGTYTVSGYILYFIATASATLTAIYSLRTLYLTFFNYPNINKLSFSFIHESYIMIIPMLVLAIYSIFIGYYRDKIIYQLNIGLPHSNSWIETEMTLPTLVKYLPLILGLSLSLGLVFIYEYSYDLLNNRKYIHIYNYLNQRIYYDHIINNQLIRNVLIISGKLSTDVDNGLLRVLGSSGVSRLLRNIPLILIINLIILNL